MKRKTLGILASVAVIPCALIMASCGGQLDQSASVDTKGNYQASSMTTVTEYTEKKEVKTEITTQGYHFTMDVKGGDETVFMNGYVKLNEAGLVDQVAMTMRAKDSTLNYYVKDSVLYMETMGQGNVIRTKMSLADFGGAETLLSSFTNEGGMFTADDYVGMVGSYTVSKPDNFLVEVAQDEANFKLHVKLTEKYTTEEMGTTNEYNRLESYVVFKNNQFVGATLETSGKTNFLGKETNMSMKMAIAQFNGQINFPSFDNFKTDLSNLGGRLG